MRRLLLAFSMLLLLIAIAPGLHLSEQTGKTAAMQTVTHPNGLALVLEDTFTVSQTPSGFRIEAGNEREARFQVEIVVRLENGPEPAGNRTSVLVDRKRINYRIESLGTGGSGGTEVLMTAWHPCSGKQIMAIQRGQAELEEDLDFQRAFQILAHATCGDQGTRKNE